MALVQINNGDAVEYLFKSSVFNSYITLSGHDGALYASCGNGFTNDILYFKIL